MFKSRGEPKRVIIEESSIPFGKKRRGWLRYVFLATAALVLMAVMAWQSAYAAHHPTQIIEEGQRLADVKAGQLLIPTQKPGLYRSAALQSSSVDFQVGGMVITAALSQTFSNQTNDWIEAVYAFPLPEKAAINQFRMRIGERLIESEIKEKQVAKKIYQQAKAEGKKAGLLEQQRPNLFTSRVANIPPGETIRVELRYIEPLSYQQGRFSFRFPMTITPRNIPGKKLSFDQEETLRFNQGTGWGFATDQVPDAAQITPWLSPVAENRSRPNNPIAISATIDMAMPLNSIDSAYHNIVLSRQANQYQLELAGGAVPMEQDFVLHWQPTVGREPVAALFSEKALNTKNEAQYLQMMVLPPQEAFGDHLLPREVVYIIDTSGSMDGVSITQARESLLLALQQLRPEDRFNIIEFNSHTTPLFRQAVSASTANLAQAQSFVRNLRSGGGTEMLPALQYALKDSAPEQFVRQIIFITDGAVGNEEALFTLINQHLQQSRLFTVGIGSAPNSYFMRKAAHFGRGSFTYIGDTKEVQEKMSALFAQLQSPVMSDVHIEWPDDLEVDVYPERIPDLYRGQPLLLNAKVERVRELGATSGYITVKGNLAGQPWQQVLTLTKAVSQPGVAVLWAREKISRLLDKKISGTDEQEIKQAVIPLALTHQLLSPYTSFVAVEKTPARPQSQSIKTAAIPNSQPKGQGVQQFAYPKTATRAGQSLYISFCLLLLAVLMFGYLKISQARNSGEGQK